MTGKKIMTVIIAASLLISASGCGKKNDQQQAENTATNVTVYTVGTDSLANEISYTGELKTADNTIMSAKVSAKIIKVNADEGDYVHEGDVLAELDTTDLKTAYDTALAGYNSALASYNSVTKSSTKQASTNAKNNLTSAQLSYSQALENYNREKELYESNSSVKLAEQGYQDALRAYNTEKELYDSGSSVKLAEQTYNDAVSMYNREKELYDNDTSLISSRNSLETAEENLKSMQALYDIGAVSKIELDNAAANVENLRASLATVSSQRQTSYNNAYSQMVTAEENLRKIRLNESAGLDAAYSQLVSAEENLKTVRLNSGVAYTNAKNTLDNASNALAAAKENIGLTDISNQSTVETAAASLESARNSLKTATDNLNNSKIRALSSGYISTKAASVGQMASPGVELFSIKNTEKLMAEIEVTESVIPYISQGTKAVVNVQSAGMDNIDGIVTLVNPTKNEKTGMYTVQVDINNTDGKLNAGMFADVKLAIQESDNAITVPNSAVTQENEEYYVYTVSTDGKNAEKHTIAVGIESDDYTEVVSGINVGDRVIVTGQSYITEDNTAVNIVTE
ncbi:MAG: efflux RND transporter periplasmic adaptor subunit [bacterium]|nr:efflux RND transporter periplasmic adaptor subunit [bacterium]